MRAIRILVVAAAVVTTFQLGPGDGANPALAAKERRVRYKPVRPAHHQGHDCLTCHTTWRLPAIHDPAAAEFNSDCILCHGDMLGERTRRRSVPDIHRLMLPYYYGEGQKGPDAATCAECHKGVDFDQRSAGALRLQVAVQDCWQCHSRGGSARVDLYRDRE